jgi:hypothetical protein
MTGAEYSIIVAESLGDIYNVGLDFSLNPKLTRFAIKAGNDPTLLGSVVFDGTSDVVVKVRFKYGVFVDEPKYDTVLNLGDPQFFQKLRALFVDDLCFRDYSAEDLTWNHFDDYRREYQAKLREKLEEEKYGCKNQRSEI